MPTFRIHPDLGEHSHHHAFPFYGLSRASGTASPLERGIRTATARKPRNVSTTLIQPGSEFKLCRLA